MEVDRQGVWVQADTYKQDFGNPEDYGHSVYKITNPETHKLTDAVFVPKRKANYWDGSIKTAKRLCLNERVDDDLTALRDGQVGESFNSEATSWTKALPQITDEGYTFQDLTNPAPEATEEEEAGGRV